MCIEIPESRGAKCQALFLTFDDEANSHALYAARAQAGLHLLPQDRRKRVPIEAIQNSAALLGANEILVHVLRVFHRVANRSFRDLMEDDAFDRNLRPENLFEVPADRLTFAVRVGRQIHLAGALQGGLQRLDVFALVAGDHVIRFEVAVGVDAETSPLFFADLVGNLVGRLRQIPDVAVARPHFIAAFQNAFDRSRLCRRFNDHECFCHGCRNYVLPAFTQFSPRDAIDGADAPPGTLTRSVKPYETAPTGSGNEPGQLEFEKPRQQASGREPRTLGDGVHIAWFPWKQTRQNGVAFCGDRLSLRT